MLRARWILTFGFCALVSLELPADQRAAVLAALAFGAVFLAAITRWGRADSRLEAATKAEGRESPLRTLPTKDELPSPSGTHLRPSTGF